jgi:hypothetical protein
MRPITLGRKNWIHIGSQEAGSKVAAILSVIETCRRLKISPRDYLSAVLPGLAVKQTKLNSWPCAREQLRPNLAYRGTAR